MYDIKFNLKPQVTHHTFGNLVNDICASANIPKPDITFEDRTAIVYFTDIMQVYYFGIGCACVMKKFLDLIE